MHPQIGGQQRVGVELPEILWTGCMFMILHLVVTRSMSTLQEVTYTGGILETKDMVLNVIIPWFIQMKRLLLHAEARTQLP